MNIIYMILTNCSGDICGVAQFLTLFTLFLVAVVALPVGLLVIPTIFISVPLIKVVKLVRNPDYKWNVRGKGTREQPVGAPHLNLTTTPSYLPNIPLYIGRGRKG